jgi:hypothetical protein
MFSMKTRRGLPNAYDVLMENQIDLVDILVELSPLAVIKG